MSSHERSPDRNTEVLLLGLVIVWAVNYPVAKYAIGGINIFAFNSIRFIVATLTLIVFSLARGTWRPVVHSDWPRLLNAGFIAHVLYQVVFVLGLSMTTAGNSAVILSTSPLWTILLHARMHKEKLRRPVWIGMLLSLAGIILIVAGSGKKLEFGGHEMVGDLICLAAAMLWALNTTLQKPLLAHYSAAQLSLVMVAAGAVGLTVIAIPAMPATHWAAIPWTVYAATIGSGMFSIGLSNVVWSHGIQRIGAGRTANFNNLVPVAAFILSYILLHETILPIQILGAATTVAGVWIVRR